MGYEFGDVISQGSAPNASNFGIGGKHDVIWWTASEEDGSWVYELDPTDFSNIRSALVNAGVFQLPGGIGGDSNTIWFCESFDNTIQELSTVDFSISKEEDGIGYPDGIGGDSNVIWYIDGVGDDVHELSMVDFSSIRSANIDNLCQDIGGDSKTIWMINGLAGDIQQLSTVDFSVIRATTEPVVTAFGCGGGPTVIWFAKGGIVYKVAVGLAQTLLFAMNF